MITIATPNRNSKAVSQSDSKNKGKMVKQTTSKFNPESLTTEPTKEKKEATKTFRPAATLNKAIKEIPSFKNIPKKEDVVRSDKKKLSGKTDKPIVKVPVPKKEIAMFNIGSLESLESPLETYCENKGLTFVVVKI